MAKKPTRIDSIFSQSTALADLARTARDQAASGTRIVDRLPEEIKPHVIAATIQGERLRITVDSPAWAARLRFLAPELAELLEAVGAERLDVRVRPPSV